MKKKISAALVLIEDNIHLHTDERGRVVAIEILGQIVGIPGPCELDYGHFEEHAAVVIDTQLCEMPKYVSGDFIAKALGRSRQKVMERAMQEGWPRHIGGGDAD